MKRIVTHRYTAVLVAYIVASYAYTVVFDWRMDVLDPTRQAVSGLLMAAPVWFLMHMPLVLLCTLNGGRGGWDQTNSIAGIAFVVAFVTTLVVTRNVQRRMADRRTTKSTVPSEGAPSDGQ